MAEDTTLTMEFTYHALYTQTPAFEGVEHSLFGL